MFAASKTDSASTGGYQISRSLRFNSADSANLTRTPSSASNQKTWTWSGWVKRSALGTNQTFFNAGGNGFIARFNSSTDYLEVYNYSGAYQLQVLTAQVFRDVSAWYHIVIAIDTTQATDTNRFKLYVNGSQVTSFYGAPTYPSQNTDLFVNGTGVHALGVLNGVGQYFDGYMTEINFVNAQQLTPSSFGETNAQTGVWQPKAYSGSYGTNGFYLNFSDNSNTTAATLGKDYSGNGNNWTPNNFSVTAGAGNDSLVDSPTSYGTDTGVGGTVRGNYATLNPLNATPSALISNGNLYALSNLSGHYTSAPATISVTSGKWYAEVVFTRVAGSTDGYYVGVADAAWQASQIDNGGWYGRWWRDGTGYAYGDAGNKITGTTNSSYGATYTQGDVMGIALDMDAGTLTFYKNGTSQGVAFTGITGTKTMAAGAYKDTGITLSFDINLGQRPFAYTAPSGFKALCTQNLPTPTIGATTATLAGKYFNPVLYTGTGSSLSVTGVGFQPDFVWVKGRSGSTDHALYDAVRGVQKQLESNTTTAETTETTGLTAFNSDGFTTGALAQMNTSAATYVAWNWKANGSGSTNTAGSLSATVSASSTSGFSVATFTSQSSGTATVGHGLGVAPAMYIAKIRTTDSWYVYHTSLGAGNFVQLNSNGASAAGANLWNSTAPTSSVFSMGSSWAGSLSMLVYCFAPVAGYSAFGSYTGNGSADGPFVFCGMRPAYLLVKNATSSGDWIVVDAKRNTYNMMDSGLQPNGAYAEASNQNYRFDFLSNGFKVRTTNLEANQSGNTIIFMAFAEAPQKFSLAR